MTTTETPTAAPPPYPWPDADWLRFHDLITAATWAELDARGRLTLPADLFRAVRGRVFGFLSTLDTKKGHWLDGNVAYMTAAACRELFKAGRIERVVYAMTTVPSGLTACVERNPHFPHGCFNVALTSLVAPTGRAGFVAPVPAGWDRFTVTPVPMDWAARPLATMMIPACALSPDALIPRYGEPGQLGVRPPSPTSLPDDFDDPYHPLPEVLSRLGAVPLAADMRRADIRRYEAYRDEVLMNRPGYWGRRATPRDDASRAARLIALTPR